MTKVGEQGRELAEQAYLGLRDDASAPGFRYASGVIDTLRRLELLTDEQHELWERRIEDARNGNCPDDGDHGADCRTWCAICGPCGGKTEDEQLVE